MKQNLPCGSPFIFNKKNDKFSFHVALNPAGWSFEAQDWLNFMSYDTRFVKDDGEYYPMKCALTGEHEIIDNQKRYSVDGFIRTKDVSYFLEYYGCRYHTCPYRCGTKCIKGDTTISDYTKRKILEKYGTVLTITGCQWRKLRCKESNNPWFKSPKSPFSDFYYRVCDIREDEILQNVYDNKFEGLLLVDLDTPPELKKSFSALNIGTIFTRINVKSEMLNQKMKEQCEKRGYKFSPQLSMVFKHENYLCTSDMLNMYHQEPITIR